MKADEKAGAELKDLKAKKVDGIEGKDVKGGAGNVSKYIGETEKNLGTNQ